MPSRRNVIALIIVVLPMATILGLELAHKIRWERAAARAARVTAGMSKEDVRATMGEPDRAASPARADPGTWDAWWYLVPRNPFVRASQIRVEFDPERVRRVELQPAFQIRFDREDWRRSSPHRRGAMIVDLLNRTSNFRGMTRDRVLEMLGPPDRKDWEGWELLYDLGPQRGSLAPVDDDWLRFKFDASGNVSACKIIPD